MGLNAFCATATKQLLKIQIRSITSLPKSSYLNISSASGPCSTPTWSSMASSGVTKRKLLTGTTRWRHCWRRGRMGRCCRGIITFRSRRSKRKEWNPEVRSESRVMRKSSCGDSPSISSRSCWVCHSFLLSCLHFVTSLYLFNSLIFLQCKEWLRLEIWIQFEDIFLLLNDLDSASDIRRSS